MNCETDTYSSICRQMKWQTRQVPCKHRTSTEQAPNKLGVLQITENEKLIISSIGNGQYTLKQLMEKMGLKHRPTFMENYLVPSIKNGMVRLLFPDKPQHPRQNYLLTVKGLTLYQEMNKTEPVGEIKSGHMLRYKAKK